jgi:hypothetical protein
MSKISVKIRASALCNNHFYTSFLISDARMDHVIHLLRKNFFVDPNIYFRACCFMVLLSATILALVSSALQPILKVDLDLHVCKNVKSITNCTVAVLLIHLIQPHR